MLAWSDCRSRRLRAASQRELDWARAGSGVAGGQMCGSPVVDPTFHLNSSKRIILTSDLSEHSDP